MFVESTLFLFALTINSTIIYWQKLKNASKLSIFLGSIAVFGVICSYYYYEYVLTPVNEIKEFNQTTDWKYASSVYNFTVTDIKGKAVSLKKYEGHVLLIVNVASECGLTDENYEELVELDSKYRGSKSLRILAFPCNQFGEQEPGTNEEICKFAERRGAKFDFFDIIEVNGENAHPLWKYLKYKKEGTEIEWNFAKFVVDKNGTIVERYHPHITPLEIVESFEEFW